MIVQKAFSFSTVNIFLVQAHLRHRPLCFWGKLPHGVRFRRDLKSLPWHSGT